MIYHKVLEKQISKLLPDLDRDSPTCRAFFQAVSDAYTAFEKDKKLSDHAFTISEKEYQEVTGHLRQQNEIRKQSIDKLKAAIASLDASIVADDKGDSDDLIHIISYLQFQINQTKELEQQLINARDIAEKAARVKSDFLSIMSHEIRTPLNAIIGNTHLLLQEEVLPSQRDSLRAIQISSDNLLSLINDILDFSKIEEGKIIFIEKDIDIRHFVNNIKMANRLRASEKGNTIRVMFDDDIPSVLKGDDIRLGQVLNNLISNAVKFTRNGQITIELQLVNANAETVEIYFAVKDTGIGIPEAKQQLIFERFTQANSEITREFGGSGLGLTIIRRLLNLQNSDIQLSSKEGAGSIFFFTLRFKRSSAVLQEEKVPDRENMNLQGIRVLLVEDVEFNIMVAEKMLNSWNAKVDIAENGLAGLGKAKQNNYDIILMDLQMPVMDGYSAAKAIRDFNTNTPIIALTASASIDMQHKAIEYGMNDFVSKPFNPYDLYNIVFKYTLEAPSRIKQ
jgi:signal transduction histidine kinase/ActR/RegA family two-component response regulator